MSIYKTKAIAGGVYRMLIISPLQRLHQWGYLLSRGVVEFPVIIVDSNKKRIIANGRNIVKL